MRIIYVLVPDSARDDVVAELGDMDIEYTVADTESSVEFDEPARLFQIPIPADAVGPVIDTLSAAGVDVDRYVIVASGETAATPTWDELENRYASDYDPLTRRELRSKAMDMSPDPATYYALMILSAFIATAGLLADSPAIIVGSMVIAPIVNPVLTASVGAVTGDRQLITTSFRMQALGIVVSVLAALALSLALRFGGFSPRMLDLSSIELIGVRLAPNVLALIVGVAAGVAAAIGVTTKGPISLIGVMVAAALIPAAAASGIGLAWENPPIALGTFVLLIVTMVLINVATFATFWALGYRPRPDDASFASNTSGILEGASGRQRLAVVAIGLVFALLLVGTIGASAQQVAFERTANDEVRGVIEESGHENLTVIGIQSEYADPSPFTGPESITVLASHNGSGDPPTGLSEEISERIAERTDRTVTVRVRFVDYQETTASAALLGPGVRTAARA